MNKKKHSTLTAFFAMIPIWIIAGVISFSLSECTNKENPIPRRTAYPRVNLCDTVYVKSSLLPVNFEINAEAIASEDSSNNTNDGSKWINVFYPKYNATLYYTYTPVTSSTIDDVIDNRIERISLNIGSLTSEMTEMNTPSGVIAKIISTPTSEVTPLQFIATNNLSWVISGAFCFNETTNISTDSISPILKAVNNDLFHTIKNLNNDAR